MTTQDYRQFSSDSSLHTKKEKNQGGTFITGLKATVRFHLIEWFVDVLMSFQVLPTIPHNVGILLRILGGCQISKLIHLHTKRERSLHIPREFQISNLVDNTGSGVDNNRERCVLSRARFTTRDTGRLPVDSFLH